MIEPRVEEIFMLVKREIEKNGTPTSWRSGVVITGGSTILEGMPELAEEVLGMPVRRGAPMGVGGLVDVVRSPSYATGVGLVRYGVKNLGITHFARGDADNRTVWQRMRSWFGEVF